MASGASAHGSDGTALVNGVAAQNAACFDCHAQDGERAGAPLPNTKTDATTQDSEAYERSVHRDLACVDCHTDASAEPHEARLAAVECGGCHQEQVTLHLDSVHGPVGPSGRERATCRDCHGVHDTLSSSDPESSVHASRIPELCGGCHAEVYPPNSREARAQDFERYDESIHHRALEKGGLLTSATCVSCHTSHDTRRPSDPRASINRRNVPETCGACHQGATAQYQQGIHGKALANGSVDTPVCTDCHGEHGIRDRSDPQSRVYAGTVSKTTCPQCHSAVRINDKHDLADNQVTTYQQSFHGLADQFGLSTVANCASCHGAHLILHSSDPASSVNEKNLPKTCGSCHPGASANFAAGGVHQPVGTNTQSGAILGYARFIYIALIALTISGMALHNVLDYVKTVRVFRRSAPADRRYLRFVVTERRQHFLLASSFMILVVTGFALRYPDAFWVKPFVNSPLSFVVRGYAHRLAGVVFILLSVYHVYYLIFTVRGREQWRAMRPRASDASELKQQMLYYLGLREKPAHFGRFSYIEKSEYFALLWGSLVMIATGFILWFEEPAMRVMPKWGWDLAELIHLYEAWLATLAIIVWHLYHVAFKPSLHGVSYAMFTGELTEEEMHHEHPAELETLRDDPSHVDEEGKPRPH